MLTQYRLKMEQGPEPPAPAAAAVRWVPDEEAERCMRCKPDWQFRSLPGYGRHHCRKCGQVVCKTCMHDQEILLDHWVTKDGAMQSAGTAQKVCKTCAATRAAEHRSIFDETWAR